MRAAVAAASLVLASCGDGYVFHGDREFTAGERAEIETAADEMSTWTGAPRFTFVWDGRVLEEVQRIRKAEPPVHDAEGCLVHDRAAPDIIFIAPGLSLARVRQDAEHEIGHRYGFHHTGKPGVMSGDGRVGAWSAADVAECRRVLGDCPDAAAR